MGLWETRRDGHAAVTGWLWLECIAVAPACSVLKGGYILRLDSLSVNVASTEVGPLVPQTSTRSQVREA